jgi:RNA polymerase sigma factor (sigma-70 family)
MAQSSLQNVLSFARRLAEGSDASQSSDHDLLDHFRLHNDHASFAALIERHGGMVWASCRRVLTRDQDAEDCFQAAFLVLARKAGTLKRSESLGPWLHRVAYRLALRCQNSSGRRRQKEGGAAAMKSTISESDATWNELRVLLDCELEQLPQIYRTPLVLCYLEGNSNSQAARELGWPIGTLKGRLVRGKQLLRQRLEKRGLTLGAVALVALLTEQVAQASVPGILMSTTTTAATAFAIGKPASASAGALSLANGFLRAASLGVLLKSAVLLIGLTLATSGSALMGQSVWSTGDNEVAGKKSNETVPPSSAIQPKKAPDRLDVFGDPLPPDAISRLGSIRYRPGWVTHSLVVTPDGKSIVTEGGDGIRFLELATGKETNAVSWRAAPGENQGRHFSPDGSHYVAVADSGMIGIFSSITGELLTNFGEAPYIKAHFSPDGKWIAAQGRNPDCVLDLFDAKSGKRIWRIQDFRYGSGHLAFSKDGSKLVAAGCNALRQPPLPGNCILVLETVSGKQLQKIELGEANPIEMALAPSGNEVAIVLTEEAENVAGMKNTVRVWNLDDSKQRLRLEPPVITGIHGMALFNKVYFSVDNKTLVAGLGNGGQVIVWDLTTGKELRRLGEGLDVISCFAETPDGKTLIVAGGERVHLIDYATGKDATIPFGASARAMTTNFSKDGATVLTGSSGLSAAVSHWDSVTGKKLRTTVLGNGSVKQFSGDGSAAIVEKREAQDLITWRELTTDKQTILSTTHDFHPAKVEAISTSGKWVALGKPYKEQINLFDGPTGNCIGTLRDAELTTYRLQISGDEKLLFAFSPNQTVRIWDLQSMRKLAQYVPAKIIDERPKPSQSFQPPPVNRAEAPFEIALSPDGKHIASTDLREYILIRDAFDGQNQIQVDTGKVRPRIMTFSPDSKLLAWTSWDDPSLHLLDVASQKEVRVLDGHKGLILSMAFSKDGKKLVSSSTDGTSLVWDFERIRTGIR